MTGTARLTRDPELKVLPSGTTICKLGLAWSNSRKDSATGQWEDYPSYINMTVFGNQAEACSKYLAKGRPIVFTARLEYRTWETDAGKRSVHELVADQVQFMGGRDDVPAGGGGSAPPAAGDPLGSAPPSAAPPVAATPEDEIPFL